MNEFLAMGGYAFYVWGAYGLTTLAVVTEILALNGRRKSALEEARLSGPDGSTIAGAGRGIA